MLQKFAAQVKTHTAAVQMKEGNKNVSLTTSKINYMDPRITIAFCKRSGLEVGKVFSKTIQQKFPWAMDVPEDYSFVRAQDKDLVPTARQKSNQSGCPTSPNS